jgi:hypothetical protein
MHAPPAKNGRGYLREVLDRPLRLLEPLLLLLLLLLLYLLRNLAQRQGAECPIGRRCAASPMTERCMRPTADSGELCS